MYPEIKKYKKLTTVLLWMVMLVAPSLLKAQTVTEVVTDYAGYWKSGVASINSVKPDNSHNLLSFTYNGTRYSTGVNDQLLRNNGLNFIAGDYKALPVSTITGAVNSNTKIGLGAMYDGVYNGSPATKPERSLTKYLSDGLKGLDLGTCVANLPAGNIFLPVADLKPGKINDGIPDLLITQVADPSASSLDTYEFTDVNGNRVGNSVEIILNTLPVVGNWTADFYEASTNPMTLQAGFAQTDRPIRLWAADFSLFGITPSMVNQIAYFKIRLNGNSDVAFVAYNDATVNIISSLPATLSGLQAKPTDHDVTISWKTLNEINTDHFTIEASVDGVNFTDVATLAAAGNSTDPKQYSYVHHNVPAGKMYYRLKTVDKNGSGHYSEMLVVSVSAATKLSLAVYPNPATEKIYIKQNSLTGNEVYQVRSISGILMMQKTFAAGSMNNSIDVSKLSKGTYLLIAVNGSEQEMTKFIKQ
jgi:hypothetical protein